jgi:putative Mg2+ transporter-C (MgtC) family protein
MSIISSGDITIITRIFVAVILGIILGLQREKRKIADKSPGIAGLRTHALVCLGTCLVVAVGSILIPSSSVVSLASVMTGIGFIGAGTIMSTQGRIKGLTNAASIWTAAAIGVAVGLGFYLVSFVAAILAILILELKRFEAVD